MENKYTKWYFAIIKNASERAKIGYVEKHHIIPRCMGGPNTKNNIVLLTAREHFICHVLLTKMTADQSHYKLVSGLHRMMYSGPEERRTKISARIFESCRRLYAKTQSEKMKSIPRTEEWRNNIGKAVRGRKYSAEHCAAVSERQRGEKSHRFGIISPNRGKSLSEETKKKLSEALSGEKHPMFGKHGTAHYNFRRVASDETKEKLSLIRKGKPQSPEHKQKRIEALKAYHEKRRLEKT